LAASAVAGTLLSAALVYLTTMKERKSIGPLFTSVVDAPALGESNSNAIARIADQLARHDFIYLSSVWLFSESSNGSCAWLLSVRRCIFWRWRP
jgi:Flp pilus assembly protein TadB